MSLAATDISNLTSKTEPRNITLTIALEDSEEIIDPAADPRFDRPNMEAELEHSINVTSFEYSGNGKEIVTGSEEAQAMIWSVHDLKVLRKMTPHNDGDVGTPIVHFGCHGNVVLGLSTNDFTKNSYPYYYMFQVGLFSFLFNNISLRNILVSLFKFKCHNQQPKLQPTQVGFH